MRILQESIENSKIENLRKELKAKIKEVATSEEFGFEDYMVDDYFYLDIEELDGGRIRIEVRAEVDYEGLEGLISELDPIIQSYDTDSYFEPVAPGIMEAYLSMKIIKENINDFSSEEIYNFAQNIDFEGLTEIIKNKYRIPKLKLNHSDIKVERGKYVVNFESDNLVDQAGFMKDVLDGIKISDFGAFIMDKNNSLYYYAPYHLTFIYKNGGQSSLESESVIWDGQNWK